MSKVEIAQFDGGMYAVRRTNRHFFFFKSIEYLRLGNSKLWSEPNSDYVHLCFSRNLDEVKTALALSGSGNGTPISKNMIISVDDCAKMNEIAENDEGMKDMLLKTKEYFLLKKK